MAFQGTYPFNLDAKNRLTIPSRYRPAFGDGLTLAKSLDRCVQIWRPEEFEVFTRGALEGLNRLSREYRELNRFFMSGSHQAELDGAGRVMLPQFLRDHAGIEREIALVGAGESLEVWDRDAWSAYDSSVAENVEELASRLGG